MIEVEMYGSGKDVVVLHGVPVPPESVEAIYEELANSYRVWVPDYNGLGVSPRETGSHLAEALLAKGVKEAAVVGHSFGAYHGFQLARSSALRVTRLAAISPLVYLPEEVAAGYEELAAALEADALDITEVLLGQWFTPEFLAENDQLEPMIRGWFDELGTEAIITAARVDSIGPDLRPTLGDIDVPVYIRVGAQDQATPPEWSREIAELLPDAELDIVENVGHFPHLEDRRATLKAIGRFLSK